MVLVQSKLVVVPKSWRRRGGLSLSHSGSADFRAAQTSSDSGRTFGWLPGSRRGTPIRVALARPTATLRSELLRRIPAPPNVQGFAPGIRVPRMAGDVSNPTFHVRENCCQNFSLQWVSAQFSLQSPLKQNLREIRQLLVVFRVYRNSSSENCDKRGKSG